MPRQAPARITNCPQCGFRFRGRPEDHQHLSPLARRLQLSGFIALFPVMLGVAAFLYFTRQDDGRMIEFTGRANAIMLAIFSPSILLFAWSMWAPKHATYRCPQCSWERTLGPRDRLPAVDPAEGPTDAPPPSAG